LALFEHRGQYRLGSPSGFLRAELATRPRGVRPRELVEVLGTDVCWPEPQNATVVECDGARFEPLSADDLGRAVGAPHAMGRAS